MTYQIRNLPLELEIESKVVLKKANEARSALAELKGVAGIIPNQNILINTLSLQEAKDSSAIENIITTQDELYESDALARQFTTTAAKEVYSYVAALKCGFEKVKHNFLLTKISFVEKELNITRLPATRYLDELSRIGLMQKMKLGRENYYVNTELMKLIINVQDL